MERDGEYSDGLYAINDPRSCFFLDGRGTSCFFRSRRDAKGLRQPSEYRDWYTWCILHIYIYSLPRTRYTRKRHLQRAVSLRFKRERKREKKACMRDIYASVPVGKDREQIFQTEFKSRMQRRIE